MVMVMSISRVISASRVRDLAVPLRGPRGLALTLILAIELPGCQGGSGAPRAPSCSAVPMCAAVPTCAPALAPQPERDHPVDEPVVTILLSIPPEMVGMAVSLLVPGITGLTLPDPRLRLPFDHIDIGSPDPSPDGGLTAHRDDMRVVLTYPVDAQPPVKVEHCYVVPWGDARRARILPVKVDRFLTRPIVSVSIEGVPVRMAACKQ